MGNKESKHKATKHNNQSNDYDQYQKKGFIAKKKGERLHPIASIILQGVYDDNNVWSCLRGMRFIVRDIFQLATGNAHSDFHKFIKCSSNEKLYYREKQASQFDQIKFPKPKNLNINMMPFKMTVRFSDSGLPNNLQPYWPLIDFCLRIDTTQSNQIGYLTIQESSVDKGRTQRRPGLHVETPGIICIKNKQNESCIKGGGDVKAEENMSAYWASWGGGGYSGDMYDYQETDGIYMASSVDNTCAIWNCKIEPVKDRDVIGHLGNVEHLRSTIEAHCGRFRSTLMKANTIYWLTDRTPHESLPVEKKTYRQFFRLVTKNVNVWYKQHSTPNPNGIKPDTNVYVIEENKFT